MWQTTRDRHYGEPMELLLIRHAQSFNNASFVAGSSVRQPDPSLSGAGVTQARALASAWGLVGYPCPDVLLTSLMRRTIETIIPSADVLNLPVLAQTDTFEIGGPYEGAWANPVAHPGSSRAVLSALSTRVVLPDGVTDDGWHHSGFEPSDAWPRRAAALWQRLQTEYADSVVALVSHGAFGSHLLGAALDTTADLHLANTGTALVRVDESGTRLVWFNRLDHLRQEQVTGLF